MAQIPDSKTVSKGTMENAWDNYWNLIKSWAGIFKGYQES